MNEYPTELSFERANELLDEAVAEKGASFVYEKTEDGACMYVHGDHRDDWTPGCLVGNVLHRFGVPLDEFGRFEGEGVSEVLWGLGIQYDDKRTHDLLVEAQSQQDAGVHWGEAVYQARQVVEDDKA